MKGAAIIGALDEAGWSYITAAANSFWYERDNLQTGCHERLHMTGWLKDAPTVPEDLSTVDTLVFIFTARADDDAC